MRKRKLRNTRPKALFGEVAAAGITAAATLAAAGIGAAATARAAKEQSAATIENAKQQAASIEATNANNNQLQQQSQQFIAQENEANRQIQRDLQMNLQLQSGALDSEQRRAASRIQVKKGGKVSRKKLRDAQFPLRGSILGAQFTDGADTPDGEFLGYTPEGYPAVKAKGDKHVEYHKDGNHWSSGIGFKIPGQPEIEVENDEVVIRRPNDYVIFSNTSRHGLKPSKLIEEGMPADDVLAFQEMTNREKGSSPVEGNRHKALAGASTNYILATDYPMDDLGFDMSGINVAAARRSLKRGGRCKAATGDTYAWYRYPAVYGNFAGYGSMSTPFSKATPTTYTFNYNNPNYIKPSAISLNPTLNNSTGVTPQLSAYEINNGGSRSNKSFYDRLKGISGNLWGAGIGALGNLGGAWLTSWGANRASKYLSKAYTDSANIIADAYDRLTGVDMSSLSIEMFRNQHYMPILRSSTYNVNPQLEDTTREFRRLMRATNAGTLSSAARLSRMAGASTLADEQRAKIYAEKANREEAIKQKNAEMSNEAAARNAELDVQASKDFTEHYIDLLKYNNDIANSRITGRAQAIAEGIMGSANTIAAARQAAGQSWGNAVFNVGKGFGDAIAMDTAQQRELDAARMQATRTGELSYLKRLGTAEERDAEINRLYSIINNPKSTDSEISNAQRDLIYLTSDISENTRAYNYLLGNYGLRGSLRRSVALSKVNR